MELMANLLSNCLMKASTSVTASLLLLQEMMVYLATSISLLRIMVALVDYIVVSMYIMQKQIIHALESWNMSTRWSGLVLILLVQWSLHLLLLRNCSIWQLMR